VAGPERAFAGVETGNGPWGGAVIIVVEDEPGVRSLVGRVLARAGHRGVAFADGSAGADAAADPAVPVDRLVTDLVMPAPNGIEVARLGRDSPTRATL
jgi:CheY-like chemotaxis protein